MGSSSLLPAQVSIVIIGAGPTGLALACTLLNKGVPPTSVLIIERESINQKQARMYQSRAIGIAARTLECMAESIDDSSSPTPVRPIKSSLPVNSLDANESIKSTVQTILNRSQIVERMEIRERGREKPLLISELSLLKDETRYPFMTLCPQASTESIIESRFHTLGGTLYREWSLESFDNVDERSIGDSFEIKVVNPTGTIAKVKTKILVGADGGRSKTRAGTSLEFVGYTYPDTLVLGDVKFKSIDWFMGPSGFQVTQYVGSSGMLLFIPLPDGLIRIIADDDHKRVVEAATMKELRAGGNSEDRKVPTEEELQSIVRARGPILAPEDDRNTITSVTWASRFHIAHRIVPTFAKGPVCLIGDAAHVHSPAGGQGMNTGIQDAISLGLVLSEYFQLNSILNPSASQSLTQKLWVWSTKRHATASNVLASANFLTRTRSLRNPILVWIRRQFWAILSFFPSLMKRQMRQLMGLNYR
ncbi:hypothetical protein CROQUDRAFT_135972 [Cronartium quercuum f. sp. fusiforme G11]|uniref:FAD-binding domain-containing protein n=1 Tax=Cronartium quercuum f. sp. fusiforme G11 TaxID=708437 RepID=A0A9P6NDN6_9BASI|nr:hypothetical protein CROQUDRAFT_135972 [Cronartium quercuum f. sp. fusiforme G11]